MLGAHGIYGEQLLKGIFRIFAGTESKVAIFS